jgi:hypothetical protein
MDRAAADPVAYSGAVSNALGDTHRDADSNADTRFYGDADCYSDRWPNGNSDTFGYSFR